MLLLFLNVMNITFLIAILTVGRYDGWLCAKRTTDHALRKNSIYHLNRRHRASYSVSTAVLQPRMPSLRKFIVESGNTNYASLTGKLLSHPL
jgi:hypothetical protein